MIHLLTEKANKPQVVTMLDEYQTMIKLAVDIRLGILAGGGVMHADCEQILLENGSEQDDIWGANWYPAEQRLEFEALINIRPGLGNRSMIIRDQEIRNKLEKVILEILGGVG